MREMAKVLAERALVWSAAARWHRRRMSGRVLVLAYHNVVPDDIERAGDLANHLPLSTFVAQLDALRRTHDVVPLADALQGPRPAGSRPQVAITFDDAYRGAIRYALPELVRRRLPATIFVAPAFLGGRSFWWDAVASRGGLDPAFREHALTELRGQDAAVRSWAVATGHTPSALVDILCAASEDELRAAASLPGITLGSHSWSHPNLTRLGPEELTQELVQPLAWLRANATATLPCISYPYGMHNEEVRRAARAAGYEAALAISGGWLAPIPEDPFALPRVNVPPGLTLNGLVLRGAGLLVD